MTQEQYETRYNGSGNMRVGPPGCLSLPRHHARRAGRCRHVRPARASDRRGSSRLCVRCGSGDSSTKKISPPKETGDQASSLRSWSALTPSICSRLVLEAPPATIAIADFATPSFLANSLMSSAFAAPSTGGEDNLTFTAPSTSPTISLRALRGITRTVNVTASLSSSMLTFF